MGQQISAEIGTGFGADFCANLDDIMETKTDEENGGTEIIATGPLRPATKPEPTCQEKEQPLRPFKRILWIVILIVLIFATLAATVSLVYLKLMKDDADQGADLSYGETPIRPTTEETGVLPTSQSDSLGGGSVDQNLVVNETRTRNNTMFQTETDSGSESEAEDESVPTSAAIFFHNLPFDRVELPPFDSGVLQGYANETDFEQDLAEAAKFLINRVALRNLGAAEAAGSVDTGGGGGWGANSMLMNDSNEYSWRGATTHSEEPQGFFDVTDYETNNQENGINEADAVKADDEYVYAAYGNYVVVWDKDGNQVTQVKISASESEEDDMESSDGSAGGSIFARSYVASLASGRKPHVESLLLAGHNLVVIVSSYRSGNSSEGNPLLQNYLQTQVHTYSTHLNGTLFHLGATEINGRFLDARAVGSVVHIATSSSIDTYTSLVAPFDRVKNYPTLSNEEYIAQVRRQASEFVIPQFIQRMKSELKGEVGKLPNLLRINQWQPPAALDGSLVDESFAKVFAHVFAGGVINSVALITSFDASAVKVDASTMSGELITTTSAFLSPSQRAHLYATSTKLVLATRTGSWNAPQKAMEEVTHLVVLDTIGTDESSEESVSTNFVATGTVRGYLLNPYSLDIVGGRLRTATTISRRWRLHGRPQLSSNIVAVGNSHGIDVSDRSAGQEEESVAETPATDNFITVLDLDNDLQELGSVALGEAGEVISAVRFFDDVAYCVTFEQTDPFYVVDMDNVEILGSFKLNGFSNYLHPLNDDNTLLVGIGQNVSEDGMPSGFMVTVFNVTDATNPEALVSYSVDDSPPDSSAAIQSTAQWDYKSFRYVDGKLIVPLDVVAYSTEGSTADSIRQTILGRFEGFVVFNVSPETIEEHVRISHNTLSCHYCGYLTPRSFVYDGNVMTVEGQIVSSTNLETKAEQWAFHVQIEGEDPRCCY
ncbi:beta propeller domain protein [Seminavis robusta]|uniref:Beta propeller domain protein n=1 Tax=Seminavis robusta TaxID=568900 RepID=A0A9N8D6S5_9STRA|nr:beta propeller domain protein [Seminavis robusta]|eukprot:Sro2_g001370.1 beta propeller domain protein (944) ;mRNA; r:133401-136307